MPTTGQLADGELALNLADGKLFAKKADGTVAAFPAEVEGGTETTVATELTYYFRNVASDYWDDPNNWFLNADIDYPANTIPPANSNVIITSLCEIGRVMANAGANLVVKNIKLCGEGLDSVGNPIYAELRDTNYGGYRVEVTETMTLGDDTVGINGFSSSCYAALNADVYLATGAVATLYHNSNFNSRNIDGPGTLIIQGGSISYASLYANTEMRWGYANPYFYGEFKYFGGTLQYGTAYYNYNTSAPPVIIFNPGAYDPATINNADYNYFYNADLRIYNLSGVTNNYIQAESWAGPAPTVVSVYNAVEINNTAFTTISLINMTGSLITFYDSSTNAGMIDGDAHFRNSSSNSPSGTINGTATFFDSACNNGGSATTFVPSPPPSC